MSRLTRILAMAVGSVALFAIFAVSGWAITNQFVSNENAPAVLETVALEEYQLIPAEVDVEEQFARIDAQERRGTVRGVAAGYRWCCCSQHCSGSGSNSTDRTAGSCGRGRRPRRS